MSRVHAFVDDALGDLDAVALADAIRSGRVGRADVVEAAIARAEAVNPALNALAYAAFDVARDAAAMGTGQEAFFSGVPTFIKDNVDVAGQPSMHGTDAWEPYAAAEYRRLPVGIVANGVLTRTVRDTAAFYREAERLWRNHQLPPVGDVTSPVKQRLRIAVVTRSVLREASPEVRQLTLKLAGLLEELGHRVEHVDHPPAPASFVDDFVLYWGFLALAQVRSGRRTFGRTFDPTRLDELTLGLARHTGRNLHRLPLAIMRLRMLRRRSVRFFGTYDVLLTPTVAEATPQVGYLAPTDYQTVLDRLSSWVVFTPVQNVTGVPAISLPLAQSADGMPVGMMLSADTGREALLLELAYELEEARPWARIHAPNIAE